MSMRKRKGRLYRTVRYQDAAWWYIDSRWGVTAMQKEFFGRLLQVRDKAN